MKQGRGIFPVVQTRKGDARKLRNQKSAKTDPESHKSQANTNRWTVLQREPRASVLLAPVENPAPIPPPRIGCVPLQENYYRHSEKVLKTSFSNTFFPIPPPFMVQIQVYRDRKGMSSSLKPPKCFKIAFCYVIIQSHIALITWSQSHTIMMPNHLPLQPSSLPKNPCEDFILSKQYKAGATKYLKRKSPVP